MTVFPDVRITAVRLDVREYGPGDIGLVRELLSLGMPEALAPGAPSSPDDLPAWLANGVRQPRRAGSGVRLMMLERAANRIVGSISLFHADWEIRSAEIG